MPCPPAAFRLVETKEDVTAMLEVALEENDTKFFLKVMGEIARSKGMAQLAGELKLNREGLYDSLSPGGKSA
jgi:probable addiction module antidote protein